MIQFNEISLARGVKQLFSSASLTVNYGEKIGLVGANGSGKSTLFAMLLGEVQPDSGDASIPVGWSVAHVSQQMPMLDRSALDYVLDGDAVLRSIEQRILFAQGINDGVAEAEGHTAFADADGYTSSVRAETLLRGLGFNNDQVRAPIRSLSGGWRMRLNLAQALMCRSDLLLLDEPTNHLDLDAIIWLEGWLLSYAGTLIVISHDREFLDAVCTVTLSLENGNVNRYSGNYTQFEAWRSEQLAAQQNNHEKQQQTIAHLQSYVSRFRYKATKAKQAQSRIKALERIERIAAATISVPFSFEFDQPVGATDPLLILDSVDCGYRRDGVNDIRIVERVSLSIRSGQRIGLLGANGQGKSTLMETVAGVLEPLDGSVHRGRGLRIAYFSQHQIDLLPQDETPLGHFIQAAPNVKEQQLRKVLGNFKFTGEMMESPIALFSGGEKARLVLALMIWKMPNLLLLDEPTNHLDLETRDALAMALARFDGTLILVSHDRCLLNATTNQFLIVSNGRLEFFNGDLDDYRELLTAKVSRKENSGTLVPGRNLRTIKSGAVGKYSSERCGAESRSGERAIPRRALAQVAKLEREIELLHAEKTLLEGFLSDPANYEGELMEAVSQ